MLKHLAKSCAVVVLLAGVLPEGLTAEDFETRAVTAYRHRYVTRFQRRRRLIYEPQTTMVQTAYLRNDWNPWRKRELAYVSVPVVRWMPRWQEESWPVTERQVVPMRRLVQVPTQPRADQLAGDQGRQARVVDGARQLPIGGITRLDDDLPRVGAALQPLRRY